MRLIILILLFGWCQESFANSLASETSVGSTSTVEALTIDGNLAPEKKVKDQVSEKSPEKPKEREEKFPWSAGYTITKSQSTDAGGNSIIDKTTAVNASLGYESRKRFEVGGGYSFASTPDENLVSLGPNLYLGYSFEKASTHQKSKPEGNAEAKSEAEDESAFLPSIGIKMTGASNRFVQTYTPNPPKFAKVKRPTTGINEITQSSVQFESTIKPAEWISIKPAYTIFKYSRNVADFMSSLNAPRISISRAAFSNTVSGLAEFDAALGVTFYFLESWELLVNGDYSVMAADQTNSWVEKVELADNIGAWKIGIGGSAQNSPSTSDTSVLLDVSYDF